MSQDQVKQIHFIVRKIELRLFFELYPRVMEIVYQEKGRFFVITEFQNSPLQPIDDFIVIIRDIEYCEKLNYNRGEVERLNMERRLSKLFALRSLSFVSRNNQSRKEQLERDLLNFYENDGLILIGGIQESDLSNNLQLLFYRTLDIRPNKLPPNTSLGDAILPYDLRIEVLQGVSFSKDDFALKFQELFDRHNAMLRAIISFQEETEHVSTSTRSIQEQTSYFIIAQTVREQDLEFNVQELPENLV